MAINSFTYENMMQEINFYAEKYSALSVSGLCESILGRSIPVITLGEGECVIAYVGGLFGCDRVSPRLLTRFVRDICALCDEGGSAFGFSARRILKEYTFVVIPMLNPDGNDYSVNGVRSENLLKDRLLKINGGSEDFSSWEGNARGRELRYNFGVESQEYEPEVEVGNLCNFLRFGIPPSMIFEFSAGKCLDNSIYYGDGEKLSKMAIALTQMSGFERKYRESREPRLMLSDWAKREIGCSSFAVELKSFNTLNGRSDENDVFSLYTRIRKLFFCAPLLSKI